MPIEVDTAIPWVQVHFPNRRFAVGQFVVSVAAAFEAKTGLGCDFLGLSEMAAGGTAALLLVVVHFPCNFLSK